MSKLLRRGRFNVKTGVLMGVIIIELVIIIAGELEGASFKQAPQPSALAEREVSPVVPLPEARAVANEDMTLPPTDAVSAQFVVVKDSCGTHFDGECVRVRSGPGTEYPVISRVRNDMVLKVGGTMEVDGQSWYKIVFDEWLRYPERIKNDWYIAAEFLDVLPPLGEGEPSTTTQKLIIVDRSEQALFATDGGTLFMDVSISTGLELTPTPRGTFTIFKKTPSRYMQGPLPGLADQQEYDLPGVPWNMYFTEGGAVIHGAYWHNSFGSQYSHGCVNMEPSEAKRLYEWAALGTRVIVRD